MGQIMAFEHQKEPDPDEATRTGEFAMLLYSIGMFLMSHIIFTGPHRFLVGVLTGVLLPHLASRDRRLMAHKEDVDEDAELTRLRHTVREWRADAARRGKPLRLPMMPFLLRNIWTGALILFSILTFSTFFISTVFQVGPTFTRESLTHIRNLSRQPFLSA
jgi:solute carrier family 45 protein 1/2/4